MSHEVELINSMLEACATGDLKAVEMLLRNGVSVNAAHPVNGWTPLHWASKRGHNDLVRILIAEGASLSSKNSKGETAADVANKNVAELFNVTPEAIESREPKQKVFIPNYLRRDSETERPTELPKTTPAIPITLTKPASSRDTGALRDVVVYRQQEERFTAIGTIFISPLDTLEDTRAQIRNEMDEVSCDESFGLQRMLDGRRGGTASAVSEVLSGLLEIRPSDPLAYICDYLNHTLLDAERGESIDVSTFSMFLNYFLERQAKFKRYYQLMAGPGY
ncbi:Ankyrin repeat domain-containing protein 40 [Dinochytrium kinnereticum]|nr:Ankyrin repeat domain-containing protein 40 [Dinochytrium kinnereticum]